RLLLSACHCLTRALDRQMSAFDFPPRALTWSMSAFDCPSRTPTRPMSAFDCLTRALTRPMSEFDCLTRALTRPMSAFDCPTRVLTWPMRQSHRPDNRSTLVHFNKLLSKHLRSAALTLNSHKKTSTRSLSGCLFSSYKLF